MQTHRQPAGRADTYPALGLKLYLCTCHQELLTDREGAPARDCAVAEAVMKLARQVSGSAGELAGTVLDAIAACLNLASADGTDEPSGPGNVYTKSVL